MGRPKINMGICLLCDKSAWTKSLCTAHYKQQYYSLNKDKENQSRKIHNLNNLHKIAKRKRDREKVDICYKLANRLRARLNSAIKGGKSLDYLGCSIDELKTYIELKFQEDMTWDNHTNYGWHIDHVIPLSSVDLTIEDNLKKVCHYTNLRPLWWGKNLGRRYVKED